MSRTQFRPQNRKIKIDIKPKKKCASSDIDYLLALDIFSTCDKLLEENIKQKQDRNWADRELEEEN